MRSTTSFYHVKKREAEHVMFHAFLVELNACRYLPEASDVIISYADRFRFHMAEEERQGGIFDLLLAQFPAYGDKVAELVQEHQKLRSLLHDLEEYCRAVLTDDLASNDEIVYHPEAYDKITDFLLLAQHHERLEHRLMSEMT